MMTLKKGDLLSDQLKFAFTKVSQCGNLKPKVSYNFMRLIKILEQELKKINSEKVEILKKYVDFADEAKQSFKLNEAKNDFEYKEGADKDAAKKELDAFAQTEFQVARFKFEVEDFEAAKLSPADLGLLEFMFNQPEE